MSLRLSPLIAAVMLAGCATPPGDAPDPNVPPPAAADRCDATKPQRLIGKAATPAVVETARRMSGAALVRRITPGALVTMDYRPDRLNVAVDEHDRVTAIRCG